MATATCASTLLAALCTALPCRACTPWPQRNNASTPPPGQVKSSGLTNQTQWWTGQLPGMPLGGSFGGNGGMSGALGGGSVLVHCGGYDKHNDRFTSDCFAIAASADGTMEVKAAPSLPRHLA